MKTQIEIYENDPKRQLISCQKELNANNKRFNSWGTPQNCYNKDELERDRDGDDVRAVAFTRAYEAAYIFAKQVLLIPKYKMLYGRGPALNKNKRKIFFAHLSHSTGLIAEKTGVDIDKFARVEKNAISHPYTIEGGQPSSEYPYGSYSDEIAVGVLFHRDRVFDEKVSDMARVKIFFMEIEASLTKENWGEG